MRNRGIVIATSCALAVVGLLTGCTSLLDSSGSTVAAGVSIGAQALQSQKVAVPTVGSCWTLSYADVDAEPAYPSGSSVNCSTPHQSVTFAVVEVDPATYGSGTASDLTAERTQAQYACTNKFAAIFPALVTNRENRVLWGTFVPPVSLGSTDPVWARCDLQELAVGSNFYSPSLQNLASFSSLSAAITANPADYALCANTPGSTGATGPDLGYDTTVGDCRTAQWRLESAVDEFPDDSGTAYPGYDGLYPFMHANCGLLYDSATVRGWDYYPSEQQWDAGDRTFSCWIGKR